MFKDKFNIELLSVLEAGIEREHNKDHFEILEHSFELQEWTLEPGT